MQPSKNPIYPALKQAGWLNGKEENWKGGERERDRERERERQRDRGRGRERGSE